MEWWKKAVTDLEQIFHPSNKGSPAGKHLRSASSSGTGDKRATPPDHFSHGQVGWIHAAICHTLVNFGDAAERGIIMIDKRIDTVEQNLLAEIATLRTEMQAMAQMGVDGVGGGANKEEIKELKKEFQILQAKFDVSNFSCGDIPPTPQGAGAHQGAGGP
eukprot:1198350-Karenia_brevis.AAC.1